MQNDSLFELMSFTEMTHEIILPGKGGIADRTGHLEADVDT